MLFVLWCGCDAAFTVCGFDRMVVEGTRWCAYEVFGAAGLWKLRSGLRSSPMMIPLKQPHGLQAVDVDSPFACASKTYASCSRDGSDTFLTKQKAFFPGASRLARGGARQQERYEVRPRPDLTEASRIVPMASVAKRNDRAARPSPWSRRSQSPLPSTSRPGRSCAMRHAMHIQRTGAPAW